MRRTKRGGWPYGHPPNVPFEINRASPQSVGLVAWWPSLISRGTNALRDLAGINDCSLFGNPAWVEDGEFGFGLSPDANDHFTPANVVTLADDIPWTVAVWLRTPAAFASFHGIWGNTFVVGNYARLLYYHNNTDLLLYNNSNVSAVWGFNPTTNTRYHLVIVCDGSNVNNIQLYIDGVAQGLRTQADSSQTIRKLGCIGVDTDYGWRGPIFDFRIYDLAKTAAEVQQLYAEPRELYKPLIRRWAGWKSPVIERIPRYGFTNFQVPGIV